jgi:signal transduction histidine kinase
VRSVASGYRELSLGAEAQSARSVLLAADVDVHMDVRYGRLPVLVGTMLATVLREGVTNMLRHSKAEWCEITVTQQGGQVSMEIVNDGVPSTPAEPVRNSGSGIMNLSARVASLGGQLTAGPDNAGRYRLHVTAPVSRRG